MASARSGVLLRVGAAHTAGARTRALTHVTCRAEQKDTADPHDDDALARFVVLEAAYRVLVTGSLGLAMMYVAPQVLQALALLQVA